MMTTKDFYRKDSQFLQYNNNTTILEHTMNSILDYILYGYCPGSFLENLIAGNSFVSILNADARNIASFATIHLWILENLPEESYGSADKVYNWINDVDKVRTNYLNIKKQEYIEYIMEV